MLTEENKTIAHRIYRAFNERNLSALDELTAPDIVDHTAGSRQLPGIEGVKQAWTQIFAAYPDVSAVVEEIIAEGDNVATRVAFHGSAVSVGQADLHGMMLEFARLRDGRVVELWNVIKWG